MDVVAFVYVEEKLGFWLKIRLFGCFSSSTSYFWCWWSLDLAMNRSFRAQESQMSATVRQRQQQVGSLRSSVMKEKDEELALFLEMRKREKERSHLLLLQDSEEFDAPLGADLWNPFVGFGFQGFYLMFCGLRFFKLMIIDLELLSLLLDFNPLLFISSYS